MRVLADFHHAGLFNSLRMLFEDRLGGEIYRPIGEEWLKDGYWKIAEPYNNHPLTVAQYLGIHLDYQKIGDGIYQIWEPAHDYYQKGITLEAFRRMNFDIVVISIPEHIKTFSGLASEVGAKLIYQIGNSWTVEAGLAKNVMASAKIDNVPDGINFIEYHQEFPLDIFKRAENIPDKDIYSFVNCFNSASVFRADWQLFLDVESKMTDWKFKSLGGGCRDGVADGQNEVARMMSEAMFVWHTKYGGDGYGHIIYNTGAVGRPMIVKKYYYLGKMGEELMTDGRTCICIDGLDTDQIINKIRYYSEPDRYHNLCYGAYNNFINKVNFDVEAEKLKTFVENLL